MPYVIFIYPHCLSKAGTSIFFAGKASRNSKLQKVWNWLRCIDIFSFYYIRFMNLYRAIDNNVGTLQHFITHEWHWDSTQYNKILNAIKEEDREVMKINPYQANAPFFVPPENIRMPRGYRNGTLDGNGLKRFMKYLKISVIVPPVIKFSVYKPIKSETDFSSRL